MVLANVRPDELPPAEALEGNVKDLLVLSEFANLAASRDEFSISEILQRRRVHARRLGSVALSAGTP
eukprot:1430539-Prymnesium_polylepis.2